MCYNSWFKLLPALDPKRDFLLKGIKQGFDIIDTSIIEQETNTCTNNYQSATKYPNRVPVENQILQEVQNYRYKIVKYKPKIISALGAIPKKGSTDFRLIHDCSRPPGAALNDYAIANQFHYQTIQDAMDIIQPGDYMAKIDLSKAFRSVKIHPSNHQFTGLQWSFNNN